MVKVNFYLKVHRLLKSQHDCTSRWIFFVDVYAHLEYPLPMADSSFWALLLVPPASVSLLSTGWSARSRICWSICRIYIIQLETTLLRSCLSLPKIAFALHTCAPNFIRPALSAFDNTMREASSVRTCVRVCVCMSVRTRYSGSTRNRPFAITISVWIEVEAIDFCFWRHSDFPGFECDVTRISLRIALRTLDLQIHALNSLPSGPRA